MILILIILMMKDSFIIYLTIIPITFIFQSLILQQADYCDPYSDADRVILKERLGQGT